MSNLNQTASLNLAGLLTREEHARHEARLAETAARQAQERRNRIAEGFAFALAASPNASDFSAYDIAVHATLFADTLIEELDK